MLRGAQRRDSHGLTVAMAAAVIHAEGQAPVRGGTSSPFAPRGFPSVASLSLQGRAGCSIIPGSVSGRSPLHAPPAPVYCLAFGFEGTWLLLSLVISLTYKAPLSLICLG